MGKSKDKSLDEILSRSVAEKILLVEKIWDDIKDSSIGEEPTIEEAKFLKKRLAEYKQDPTKVKTWQDLKASYLKKK